MLTTHYHCAIIESYLVSQTTMPMRKIRTGKQTEPSLAHSSRKADYFDEFILFERKDNTTNERKKYKFTGIERSKRVYHMKIAELKGKNQQTNWGTQLLAFLNSINLSHRNLKWVSANCACLYTLNIISLHADLWRNMNKQLFKFNEISRYSKMISWITLNIWLAQQMNWHTIPIVAATIVSQLPFLCVYIHRAMLTLIFNNRCKPIRV